MSTETNNIGRKIVIITISLLIIAAFCIATYLIIKFNDKPKERTRTVNTLAVLADYAVRKDVQLMVKTQGETRPQTEIDFVPQVGGKIVFVSPNFIEGGIFKKGEVLIRLEDADFEVSVIRAQANLAQAQQTLIREIAEGDLARQDYSELGSGQASALALREPQRKQAEASLLAANAELDGAKLQLTRTEVRAPFSGRVRVKNSDLGQFVTPGETLGRIFSTNMVEVRLPLTDDNLSKLDLPIAYVAPSREAAPRVVLRTVIGGQPQTWQGHIMRTDPVYDRQTRALFAIAEVSDPYGKGASDKNTPLAPGLFVDAELSGKRFENVIVLPRDGLRPDNEIYVVNAQGKVDVRQAVVLDTDEERAVIRSGVEEGELVVLSPLPKNRLSLSLKALDINNPERVLVDPTGQQREVPIEATAVSRENNGDEKGSKTTVEKPAKKSNEAP